MSALPADAASGNALRWALWYPKVLGCAVFPCRGKRPPQGLLWQARAATDPAGIEALWAEHPEANVGLVVGARMLCLDVDVRSEQAGHEHDGPAALSGLESRHGALPVSVEAITGGGGRHILFALPAGVEHGNARGALPLGLDVRAGGAGYIVVAPSVHPQTGERYRWVEGQRPDQVALAEVPAWLLALVKQAPTPTPRSPAPATPDRALVMRRASAYLATMPQAISGSGGHEALWRAALALVRGFGLSVSEAGDLIQSEYNHRCEPPWSEAEIEHKVSDAALDAETPWGYLLTAGTAPTPAPMPAPRLRVVGTEQGPSPPEDDGGPEGGEPDEALPEIDVGNRQLRDLIAEAWQAVEAANEPPRIFRRGGALAQIALDEEHGPVVRSMCVDGVHGHLARIATWCTWASGKDGPERKNARPHKDIARDMLVYPREELPELEGVAFAPLYDRTGRLVTATGYDEGARTWLHLAPGLSVGEIPDRPTRQDICDALELVQGELLVDFPLEGEADWAHALAMLLLPYLRQMIPGPTPLHLVEATGPGSGKGLLTEVVYELATGSQLVATTLPSTDDEIAKMLLAELLKAQPIVTLDNASEHTAIRSPSLASVVASTRMTGRNLGHSSMITVQNRALWILTGNNPTMSLEIARRCVRIRIAPQQDRPWLRDGFRHDPLLGWVREHRSEIVRACLILIQAWVAAGRPAGKQRLGSFEAWARTMGGLCDVVGVPGFLSGLAEMYDSADVEGASWREYIEAWAERYGTHWRTVNDLRLLATERNMLAATMGDKGDRSQQIKLGNALKRMDGRIFGDRQVMSRMDKRTKALSYRLGVAGEPVEALAAPQPAPSLFDELGL